MQEILSQLQEIEYRINELRDERDSYTLQEVHRNISESIAMLENNGLKIT